MTRVCRTLNCWSTKKWHTSIRMISGEIYSGGSVKVIVDNVENADAISQHIEGQLRAGGYNGIIPLTFSFYKSRTDSEPA